MTTTNITGTLHDESSGRSLAVEVEVTNGIWIKIAGYGQAESVDGDGWCVKVEFWDGKPQVVAWPDINRCDPVVIDLSNAAERLRSE